VEPTVFGLDLPALISLPLMIALFGFAVWYGTTQCSVGIDAEEQARRQAESTRFGKEAPSQIASASNISSR
jgi:hypothetical protein